MQNKIVTFILRYFWKKIKALKQKIWWYAHKGQFGSVGKNVHIAYPCDLTYKNIYIGSHVIIDVNSLIWCTNSKVYIADKVGIGPGTTIIGGNHNMTEIGKYYLDVTNKLAGDDEDIYIEEDVWIGADVTILKGVRIGRGAIVGAGSIVTKNIPPYGVAVGNPAKVIKYRFTPEEIIKHECILFKKT